MPSSASGNSPARCPRGSLRATEAASCAWRRTVNSAMPASSRYSARAASRRAAEIIPSTASSDRPRTSAAALSVSAASSGPGGIASATCSRANACPPSPSGPVIAASTTGSTSAVVPRTDINARARSSSSDGTGTRPESISSSNRARPASAPKSSSPSSGGGPRWASRRQATKRRPGRRRPERSYRDLAIRGRLVPRRVAGQRRLLAVVPVGAGRPDRRHSDHRFAGS